ncbi:Rpr2-domain-containing protein [Calocera cornea HHB12733]|uniref:Rpr2-domain-containing protein n=1 Tax=Calocera cornea HHB12733 TaxID=1353952 RepID=A0A165HF33_9BASI|nr:Rpr2-domain-containing protein [Calocera cornea HHB12733]
MAKKDQQAGPSAAGIQNREVLQRMNFLYQASSYLANVSALASSSDPARAKSLGGLSRQYTKDMGDIALKTVTKLDPTVKRTLCARCGSLMLPGRTARPSLEVSGLHRHRARVTCSHCGHARSLPAPPLGDVEHQPEAPATQPEAENVSVNPSHVDAAQPEVKGKKRSRSKGKHDTTARKRQRRRARPPVVGFVPLFARDDAGHAVFAGSERVDVPLS